MVHAQIAMGNFQMPPEKWSEATHELALKELDYLLNRYSDKELSNPKKDPYLDSVLTYIRHLAESVQKYEQRKFPMPKVGLHDIVEYLLEERGLARQEVAQFLDSPSRVDDFWAHRLKLTLAEAKRLHKKLRVPADLLLK
jgi:HTH-type transcriptional regulator/antitoxin HigA